MKVGYRKAGLHRSSSAGATFEQAAHNALNDVRNMAAALRALIKAGRIGVDWI